MFSAGIFSFATSIVGFSVYLSQLAYFARLHGASGLRYDSSLPFWSISHSVLFWSHCSMRCMSWIAHRQRRLIV